MLHNNVKKKFFIGIDSDGTAFDSMTVKHRRAFIPTIIKTWNLDKASDAVYEICEDINLFSKTRGIDRFSGLVPTFERLKAVSYTHLDVYKRQLQEAAKACLFIISSLKVKVHM